MKTKISATFAIEGQTASHEASWPSCLPPPLAIEHDREVSHGIYSAEILATDAGFSGHVVDVDGCVATGDTFDECCENLSEAIQSHLDGMMADAA
jgi:predicted RNase H-like HicB family nuclease